VIPVSGILAPVSPRLILASASPARLKLLRDAGLQPEVMVSDVDEGGVEELASRDAVLVLARRKAEAVADRLETRHDQDPALVVGCDSLLELEGVTFGKPRSADEAAERWRRMRGRTGLLHTGHCIIDRTTGGQAAAVDTAAVGFGWPTDREIAAYAATEEALQVAGPFTIEGRAAPWIESITGSYGTIMGVSLPVVRRLLGELGVEIVDLWP
jgi:septum formation protein